ncbi:MAG: oxaloacetate decarboxylase [Ilumatobacter sp.]|uniref:isocitrate lyase/PEP mutase family protein n=1 Tax=Ilumatobacter sp. TaxID=1967498 RepID=UPI0032999B43
MADLLRDRPSSGPAMLRRLMATAAADRAPVVLPGCYDALGARLIEQADFDAVYMSGFGTAASLLGRPDVGLLGLSEMVDNARRIADAVDVPVVADADTGYGNRINVIRTVQQYEQAGVAGIHIEDQVLPKKCGHMEDKQVVDADEMYAKIRAAAAARRDDDFVLIARTDARAPHGLDEAIRRASGCLDAGADVLFVEALQGEDEIERVAAEFSGVPLLFNWAEGAKTPPLTYDEIAALGFSMIIMPIGTLLSATTAMQQFLAKLRSAGTPASFVGELMAFSDFTDTIGLPEIVDLEQRFSS